MRPTSSGLSARWRSSEAVKFSARVQSAVLSHTMSRPSASLPLAPAALASGLASALASGLASGLLSPLAASGGAAAAAVVVVAGRAS